LGLANRAYNLLRAYIGREWERIEDISESSARRELNDYLTGPSKGAKPQEVPMKPPLPSDSAGAAMSILGVERTSTLAELRRNYKRLFERSLPANFPEGTSERNKAETIHKKVQEAYDLLLPLFDPRLKRFQSLDIDKGN
jgi:hypothetical protein